MKWFVVRRGFFPAFWLFVFSLVLAGPARGNHQYKVVLEDGFSSFNYGGGIATLTGSNLSYNISFSGLFGMSTAAQIHGPLDSLTGGSAPTLHNLAGSFGSQSGNISGTASYSATQLTDLRRGFHYISIDSTAAQGEIYGFLYPNNDLFSNAAELTGTQISVRASNAGATRETGEIVHIGNPSKSIWWRWIAPVSGQVTVSTERSTFDTLLSVYTGSTLPNLSTVAFDDDSGADFTGVVSFNSVAGTVYWIAVNSAFNTDEGLVVLALTASSTPTNDNFINSTPLTGLPTAAIGSNAGATRESAEPSLIGILPALRSVWYSWTAPTSTPVALVVQSTNFASLVGLYTGNSISNISEVDYEVGVRNTEVLTGPMVFTNVIHFSAVAGRLYRIRVDGLNGESGPFGLAISQPPSIAITAPLNEQAFTSPAAFTITTSVSDPDGTVSRVLFFRGTTFLGADNSPPFSLSLSNQLGGGYFFTAVAVDNHGVPASSSPIYVAIDRPGNDRFSSRVNLSGPSVTQNGTTVGAGRESGEPNHGGFVGSGSVWYSWTAPSAGLYAVQVETTAFDTLLGVYTGLDFSTLAPVGTNIHHVGSPTFLAQVNFNAVSGRTYLIAVDSQSGFGAPFTLNIARPPSVSISSPANGANFAFPATVGVTAVASDSDGTIRRVELENNRVRMGTVSNAPYTFALNSLPEGSYSVVAKAFDSLGLFAASIPITFTVGKPSNDDFAQATVLSGPSFSVTGKNSAASRETGEPVHYTTGGKSIWYSWTAPSNAVAILETDGSSFDTLLAVYQGTSLGSLILVASDDDGGLGLQSRAMFPVTAGVTYKFAVDGYEGDSGDIQLRLRLNLVPALAYSSPATDARIDVGAAVTVAGTATDPDGTVQQIEFIINGQTIRTVTGGNFNFTIPGLTLGNYSLFARVRDNEGAIFEAPARRFILQIPASDSFPTVSLTQPSANQQFFVPTNIILRANASDANDQVTRVDFFANGGFLGSAFTSPYSFSWRSVPAGNHQITARAFDTFGASTTSAPVNIVALALSNAGLPSENAKDFWVTDGPVFSMLETNGVIFLGGAFNHVGPNTGGGAALGIVSGSPDLSFPKVKGTIYAVRGDGAGGWYVGGDFTAIGGAPISHLAHILANRQVNTAWNPNPDGPVTALALSSDTLFAGGDFGNVNGRVRKGLASIDRASGGLKDWNPAPTIGGGRSLEISTLLLGSDTIYIGGRFDFIGDAFRTNLACLDRVAGKASDFQANTDGQVLSLSLRNNLLYVGGAFTRLGQIARQNLGAVQLATGQVTSWAPQPDSAVHALIFHGNRLFVGGEFNLIGGQSRDYLAELDVTSGQATGWDPKPDWSVKSMSASGSGLYLGGEFSTLGSETRRGIGAVDVSDGHVLPWNPISDGGSVLALSIQSNVVFAGGNFSIMGGVARKGLAALSTSTGRATALDARIDQTNAYSIAYVGILALQGNTLYLGGSFSHANGQSRNSAAAINLTTELITPWNPNVTGMEGSGSVYDLIIANNAAYLGGIFRTVGGQNRANLAAVDLIAGTPTSFNPGVVSLSTNEAMVNRMAAYNGRLYVGGVYGRINGQPRTHLAAFNLSSGVLDSGFAPSVTGYGIYDLAVGGDLLLIGGSFTQVNGSLRNNAAAFDLALGGVLDFWNPDVAGDVYDVNLLNGEVLLGGAFEMVDSEFVDNFAAVDLDGFLLPFDLAPAGPVYTTLKSGNALYVGGGFDFIADEPRSYFAAFPIFSAPAFQEQPESEVVALGEAVFLFSEVSGERPMFFQWRKNGVPIPGENDDVLYLEAASLADIGAYSLFASNAVGTALSTPAILTVLNTPAILTQPTDLSAAPGSSAEFRVTVGGGTAVRYQWRLNGVNIRGATNAIYRITAVGPEHAGAYSVAVGNAVGAVSSREAVLTVGVGGIALPFANSFASAGFIPGNLALVGSGFGNNETATRESGEPAHGDQFGGRSVWIRWVAPASGVATFRTRGSSFDTLLGVYTGSSVTALSELAGDDDGDEFFTSEVVFNAISGQTYRIAVDGFGGDSGDIVLTWDMSTGPGAEIPRITGHPESTIAVLGGSATLRIEVQSATPVTYQWLRENQPIPGGTEAELLLTNVQVTDVGTYEVRVANNTRSLISDSAVLEIGTLDANGEPVNSQDKFRDLFDSASGAPAPQSTWRKRQNYASVAAGSLGTRVLDNFGSTKEAGEPNHAGEVGGASRWFSLQPQTNGVLVIDTEGSSIDTVLAVYLGEDLLNLSLIASNNNGGIDGISSRVSFPGTNGVTYLVAVDGVNGAQGNIVLNWRLGTAPQIRQSAVDRLASVGTNVTLIVTAIGTPDPGYQWRFNGVPIGGQTNTSLVLSNFQVADQGLYSVVVSNYAGSTSSSAQVAVSNAPPQATLTAPGAGSTFNQGANITLSANASDDGRIFLVEFRANGVKVGEDTNAPYSIVWSGVAGGNYSLTAVAVDNFNVANTSAPVNITVTGVDQTPPTLVITYPPVNTTLTSPALTIQGTASDNLRLNRVEVQLNEGSYSIANGTSSWVKDVTARSGSNTIRARAFDNAGNVSAEVTRTFIYTAADTIKPTIVLNTPGANARVTNLVVTAQGTARDESALSRVEFNLNNTGFQAATGTSDWSANLSPLPGTNSLRVRSVDQAGNLSTEISRNFVYVPTTVVSVTTNGIGRISPVLHGRNLEAGKSYRVTATPGAGQIFAFWSGVTGSNSLKPALNFTMSPGLVLSANFMANPFAPLKGSYNGLFFVSADESIGFDRAGFINLALTDKGAFSGKILLAGMVHPLRGQLDYQGRANLVVPRVGKPSLSLALALDLNPAGTEEFSGTMSDGTWTATIQADRAVWSSLRRPTAFTGKHTVILPGSTAPGLPAGSGIGTVNIDPNGNISFAGSMADGSVVSQRVPVSKAGLWPFFISLSRGKGIVMGWVSVTNGAATSLEGPVTWRKQPMATEKYFPGGFTHEFNIVASRYAAPPAAAYLNLTTATLDLFGGNLPAPTQNQVQFVPTKFTVIAGTSNKLSLVPVGASGLLNGRFVHAATGRSVPLKAVVLQQQNRAEGYFLGTNQSGGVTLQAD